MSDTNEKAKEQGSVEETEEQVQAEQQEEQQESAYKKFEQDELVAMLEARDEKISELEQDLAEANEAKLRKAAELENFRKRVQRERTQIYETAKANALEDFLSVNDDLRRTLKASEGLDVNETFLDGVNLVASKFEEVLEKHDVHRIDEAGVPFNVDLHDAMMRKKPEDDSIESDTVLEVIENGYRIGDRTIRHAKVIVSE
ncbi:MAG: nucleotide exchange factor GrpE [Balneolaceae bacterium]|nr:nucleotide exchange factor GrpE [Balneolaceae bacterium]